MAYTISGTTNSDARILVLKNTDWSIEHNTLTTNNQYSISTTSGNKIVVAREIATGHIEGFGNIVGIYSDSTAPEIYILYPTNSGTYSTTSSTLTLSGTASDNIGVTQVRWTNSANTTSGTATGTTSWYTGSITLVNGSNTLRAFAYDAMNNTASGTLIVTYTASGDRGVFGGAGYVNDIDYITISTTGNASNFGDTTTKGYKGSATSNGITGRGLFVYGEANSNYINTIEYITIMTTGNAADFGDMRATRSIIGACSNNTNNRGVFADGSWGANWYANMSYVTINSAGNATNFGNLTTARDGTAGTSNGTSNRGIFGGSRTYTSTYANTIDYITISSAGNSADFGDLTVARIQLGATSNLTSNRGVFICGYNGFGQNIIDYITITSTGNATDFGDGAITRYGCGATSNGLNGRGVWAGNDSGSVPAIEYITISTPGNSSNFGNLVYTYRSYGSALSNG